jgi:16S rRNA (guanine966-N2)-methyltransferase
MMQTWVPESRFLDLFAGSGAIGIEALSRGAEYACFVDSSRKAAGIIEDNLAFTKRLGSNGLCCGNRSGGGAAAC